MKFIRQGNRLAFKFKNEIIYLDEFLDFDVYNNYCIVSDKDRTILYEIEYKYVDIGNKDMTILKAYFCNRFIASYCDNDIDLITTGPRRINESISNIMFSNYIDKIIKLFKVYLKEKCMLNGEQNLDKRVEKFKNDIQLLDKGLEESAKIKEECKNFEKIKNKVIENIEKMF